MKYLALVTTALILAHPPTANAVDLSSKLKDVLPQQVSTKTSSNALSKYASEQLGLSESVVDSGIGALLKVAQDHITSDNFALVSKALPEAQSYIENAPKSSTSSLTSMLGNSSEKNTKTLSLGYLDAAFESIGLPKEQAPLLINSIVGYMNNNGFSKEAELLKQGLSFL